MGYLRILVSSFHRPGRRQTPMVARKPLLKSDGTKSRDEVEPTPNIGSIMLMASPLDTSRPNLGRLDSVHVRKAIELES